MSSCIDAQRRCEGQATVEAAFLIPIIFILLLLLIQPAILLYDRMVMNAAAAEGCRMLATRSSTSTLGEDDYRRAVIRHLGAIPQQQNFHVHEGGCTWQVELKGDESSTEVSVRITTKAKPLPLLDFGGVLLGVVDGNGDVEVAVEVTEPTQAAWVGQNALGMNPGAWVKKWK